LNDKEQLVKREWKGCKKLSFSYLDKIGTPLIAILSLTSVCITFSGIILDFNLILILCGMSILIFSFFITVIIDFFIRTK